MRALLWSLAPMPALLLAYLLAPPTVVGGVALAGGFFVVYVVLRTVRLLRCQELANRRFVLLPLSELAPQLIHPVLQVTVSDLLASVKDSKKVALMPLRD